MKRHAVITVWVVIVLSLGVGATAWSEAGTSATDITSTLRERPGGGEPGMLSRLTSETTVYPGNPVLSVGLIAPGADATVRLQVTNYIGITVRIRLLALVDYRQTVVLWDDQRAETHDVLLKPEASASVRITLPAPAEGFHDWLLIGFYQPDEHREDNDFRKASKEMILVYRVNLYVGRKLSDIHPPEVRFQTLDQRDKTYPITGVLLNRAGPSDPWRIWVRDRVQAGGTLDYFVNVSNDQQQPMRLAIVGFLDYRQIDIDSHGAAPALFVRLDADREAFIPVQLRVPEAAGPHELLVLWIIDPFQPLESAASKRADIPARSVQSTFRTLLNVDMPAATSAEPVRHGVSDAIVGKR
jgi:hypothetical protein